MREVQRNPPRKLVDEACKHCPLLQSKPGVIYYPQNLLAAAERASIVNKRIRAGVQYGEDDLSPRCLASLIGLTSANSKFENVLNNRNKPTTTATSIRNEEGCFE